MSSTKAAKPEIFVDSIYQHRRRKETKGLRFSVKDNIAVANHANAFGTGEALFEKSKESAEMIAALESAGAEICGVCDMDPLALGDKGELSGKLLENPRYPESFLGGSSSGSALSVYRKDCDFALATDFGGSTRIPASLLGLPSLKLSPDFFSRRGFFLFDKQMDSAAFIAQDPELIQWILETLSGEQANEPQKPRFLLPTSSALSLCAADTQKVFQRFTEKVSKFAELSECEALSKELLSAIPIARKILAAEAVVDYFHSFPSQHELVREALNVHKAFLSQQSDREKREARDVQKELSSLFQEMNEEDFFLSPAFLHPFLKKEKEPERFSFLQIANLAALPSLCLPYESEAMPAINLLAGANLDINFVGLITFFSNYPQALKS